MLGKQPSIDERRQIFASLCGQFETVLDRTAGRHVARIADVASDQIGLQEKMEFTKKRAGRKPCSKNCVDPVYPANLDLILVARGDAACARQGLLPRLGPPDIGLAT